MAGLYAEQDDVVIRIQALSGVWETVGADRWLGVVPENVRFDSNDWGPNKCSFVLRRPPGRAFPDLATWAPVTVEVAGRLAWDGRIQETPTNDGTDPVISVQCEGWQYHLDDDVYAPMYIQTKMTGFVDYRTLPTADLSIFTTAWGVTVGDGAITLSGSNSITVAASNEAAVLLDLGPGNGARTISVDALSSYNTNAFYLYIVGHDTSDVLAGVGREDWIAALLMNDASWGSANNVVTRTATVTKPHRYITIGLWNPAFSGTLGAEHYFTIRGFRAFADPAYQSGGDSIMTSDVIVRDVLAHTAFLTDTTGVSDGGFEVPEFAPGALQSHRELLSAANAYDNYDLRVALGRRVVYAPRPPAPIYEIGEWSGADFQDASASGDTIYNHVIVQGTGPDNAPLTVERTTAEALPDLPYAPPPAPAPTIPNPYFNVDASGWTITAGTLTRTTTAGQYHTGPGGGVYTGSGDVYAAFTGTFKRGTTYVVTFQAMNTTGFGLITTLFGNEVTGDRTVTPDFVVPGPFMTYAVYWTPKATTSTATFRIRWPQAYALYFDTVQLYSSRATLADRFGFVRTTILPVGLGLTTYAGTRFADLFLASHRTVPFRGGLNVVGRGGVRQVFGGAAVHPAHIQGGQLLRCSHRADPDTGGWGRTGRVATVAYDHDAISSAVSLDENRAGFEALVARMSIIQGQRAV